MTIDQGALTIDALAGMIRHRREQLGLSQDGLAEYVEGLDHNTISNWEGRRYLARHLVLLRTLEALGIELVCRDIRFSETRSQEAKAEE